jgi:sugar lactone lactonase YvrE
MKRFAARTLATGFAYPEGPRWHDGALWFSDQHAGVVHKLSPAGAHLDSFAVEGGPSGLGWTQDGCLLVVSMDGRKVLRRSAGRLEVHADLSALHRAQSNDMVVLQSGRAYVGNIGFDFDRGEAPAATMLLMVEADGTVRDVADGLSCPNGMVVTPDGKVLIVAESLASRLTAFDIAADGGLCNRRVFADLPGHVPDGICLDAEGQVWFASPFTRSALRVRERGDITARVDVDAGVFACMLGGADGRDLFLCCASSHARHETVHLMTGRIDVARVDVPRAGWP